jgi:class 3 adenylate cyclase/tetratricopeptide (TPR) repeat protein
MSRTTLKSIQEQLASKADPLSLFQAYRTPEHDRLWERDAAAYCLFADRFLRHGYPVQAFELAREALETHDGAANPRLLHLRALALARAGNAAKAEEYASDLLRMKSLRSNLRQEGLALRGRIFKDRYLHCREPRERRALARKSAGFYEKAFDLSGKKNTYPGINAALMHLLAGKAKHANALARATARRCQQLLRTKAGKNDPWILATLGEACLFDVDPVAAIGHYQAAIKAAGSEVGTIAAMRQDILLIDEVNQLAPAVLSLFDVGRVAAFSGPMVDSPGKPLKSPRIPDAPAFLDELREEIAGRLAEENVTVGVSSAENGADILFAEAMLARGGELHVVMPYCTEDFVYTSVDGGLKSRRHWRERFDAVLDGASEVHFATKERCLADPCILDFTNDVIQGLALLRSEVLLTEPIGILVAEKARGKRKSAADEFREQWTGAGHRLEVIDPAPIRERAKAKARRATGKPRKHAFPGVPRERIVRALLFADVKGFSKLSEEQCPSFFVDFLDHVAQVIEDLPKPPAFANTWGDGLFMAFDTAPDAAEYAIRLLEMIDQVDWVSLGLSPETSIRIGLHVGPVFPHNDPVSRRPNFFGSHVNRAARIEPVTAPGCAYASEQFSSVLTAEAGDAYRCEYVGVEAFAKGYDKAALYRLARR